LIDLHCHPLPGIDDGAPDLEESLRMARWGWEDGIRTFVATPHLWWAGRTNRYPDVKILAGETERYLEENGIPMRIIAGTEIPTLPQTLTTLGEGPLPTLGDSRCILLEPPFAGIPDDMPRFVQRLIDDGYRILLAHPERCRTLQEDPGILSTFLPPEYPIQLTSISLTGEHGPLVQQTAVTLLRSGYPMVIASDAHASNRRRPEMRESVGVAAEVVGMEYAEQMVTEIPLALLEDRPVRPPDLS
jgi:protein-tyrosine phosphatase